jgi:hypothetical protein
MEPASNDRAEGGIERQFPQPRDDTVVARAQLAHVAPQLKLTHMMAWMALTALILGAILMLLGRPDQQDSEFILIAFFVSLLASIWAAQLGGVLMFLDARRRELAFPIYPGDYLLVCGGFAFLCRALAIASVWFMPFRGSSGDLFSMGFALLVPAGCCFFAAFTQGERLWNSILVCVGIAQLLLFGAILFAIEQAGSQWIVFAAFSFLAIAVVTMCFAVVYDLVRKTPRGWTHWLGVATSLVHDGVIAVYMAVILFLFRYIP